MRAANTLPVYINFARRSVRPIRPSVRPPAARRRISPRPHAPLINTCLLHARADADPSCRGQRLQLQTNRPPSHSREPPPPPSPRPLQPASRRVELLSHVLRRFFPRREKRESGSGKKKYNIKGNRTSRGGDYNYRRLLIARARRRVDDISQPVDSRSNREPRNAGVMTLYKGTALVHNRYMIIYEWGSLYRRACESAD